MKEKYIWLAGLFDGEGIICFYKEKNRNGFSYSKSLKLANVDSLIISEAKYIFEFIIGHSLAIVLDRRSKNKKWRECFIISINRQEDIEKVLNCLFPYLIGKKSQADLMLQLVKKHKKFSRYTNDERKLVITLKKLKRFEVISSEAKEGLDSLERVETRVMSPNNNSLHEHRPFSEKEEEEIVRTI